MTLDRILEQDFIRVTEQAAIAAARTMGLGDRKKSDRVAVEAMRHELDQLARGVALVKRGVQVEQVRGQLFA